MQKSLKTGLYLLVICCHIFFLGGCSNFSAIQHLPNLQGIAGTIQYEIQQQTNNNVYKNLLIIEPKQHLWRWIVVDSMGAPVTRQNLTANGTWQYDGFVPPNKQYRRVFNAVFAAMLTTDNWPQYMSPKLKLTIKDNTNFYYVNNKLAWQSEFFPDGTIQIDFNDGILWKIKPIQR